MVTINVMDFLVLSQFTTEFHFGKNSIQYLSSYTLIWGTGLAKIHEVLITIPTA